MLRVFCMASLVAGVSGCSFGPTPVVVYPVSGQVFYGNKPAVGVQVYLNPTSAPMRPEIPANPHGVTGPDGRFSLTTFTRDDGAAVGGYQVILHWPVEVEGEENTTDRLLGWYDGAHSQLTAQIKEGPNELKPFHLPLVTRPAEALEGIPGRN